MNVLTLKDPSILGEKHPTYGYSVWSETDGDYPVMFNVMDESKLLPDVRVTYEEALLKTSTKGREYLRLKKVKFEDEPVKKEDRVPFIDKPAPTFSGGDNKFLKDTTDLPYRIWKDMLPLTDAQSLIKDDNYNRQLNEYVMKQANELLNMIDKVRSGTQGTEPTPETTKPFKEDNTRPAAGLKSAWEERKNLPSAEHMPSAKAVHWADDEPPYSEEDMPV